MDILENINLAQYTTLKIGGPARFFCRAKSKQDISTAINFSQENKISNFILGGGSNLVIDDAGFDGLMIKIENTGVEIVEQEPNSTLVKVVASAGENWDNLVSLTVGQNLAGMENLSHIPGSVGAVVVQNVGAYGQEAAKIIRSVKAFRISDGQIVNFSNKDCNFGYRASIFNTTEKGKYIIWEVEFELSKNGAPNLTYRDLKERFKGKNPSLMEVREAVSEIRDTKFPYPTQALNGNVGSFFKNPILKEAAFIKAKDAIRSQFGDAVALNLEGKIFQEGKDVKIPAAFLIDICGLKGLSHNGAATNPHQPLVILNATGKATAADIVNLAKTIQEQVYSKTSILLKAEPEFLGIGPGDLK